VNFERCWLQDQFVKKVPPPILDAKLQGARDEVWLLMGASDRFSLKNIKEQFRAISRDDTIRQFERFNFLLELD
jgi:hypothetical protein